MQSAYVFKYYHEFVTISKLDLSPNMGQLDELVSKGWTIISMTENKNHYTILLQYKENTGLHPDIQKIVDEVNGR